MPRRSRVRSRTVEARERRGGPETAAPAVKATPPALGRPGRLVTIVIAAALVCCLYPRHSWKTYRNVNEQARLYLVKAVVEEGVLNIDTGIKTYGDLQDKATKDGHFYCDKPIGLSVLAIPVWFVLHHGSRLLGLTWSLQAMRYALTIACVILPTLGLLVVMDR